MAPYDPEVTTTCRWRFQLRDGNVFTPVCHSVQGGVSVQEGSLSRSLCPGGLCPGGSLSSGVSVQGGLYPLGSLSIGVSVQGVSVMTQCRLAQRINRNGLGFLLFPCKIYHNGLEIGVNQFFFIIHTACSHGMTTTTTWQRQVFHQNWVACILMRVGRWSDADNNQFTMITKYYCSYLRPMWTRLHCKM